MKAVIQRVSSASVSVDGQIVSQIERGLLILLGAQSGDTDSEMQQLLGKLHGLRIFNEAEGKMNLACEDIGGEYLVVSQFTLLADTRRGKRPSYIDAMHPTQAEPMYERFCEELARLSARPVKRGVFGANMQVALVNDGPVTILLDYPPPANA